MFGLKLIHVSKRGHWCLCTNWRCNFFPMSVLFPHCFQDTRDIWHLSTLFLCNVTEKIFRNILRRKTLLTHDCGFVMEHRIISGSALDQVMICCPNVPNPMLTCHLFWGTHLVVHSICDAHESIYNKTILKIIFWRWLIFFPTDQWVKIQSLLVSCSSLSSIYYRALLASCRRYCTIHLALIMKNDWQSSIDLHLDRYLWSFNPKKIISMAKPKTAVSPVLMHWRYCSLMLSRWSSDFCVIDPCLCSLQRLLASDEERNKMVIQEICFLVSLPKSFHWYWNHTKINMIIFVNLHSALKFFFTKIT